MTATVTEHDCKGCGHGVRSHHVDRRLWESSGVPWGQMPLECAVCDCGSFEGREVTTRWEVPGMRTLTWSYPARDQSGGGT